MWLISFGAFVSAWSIEISSVDNAYVPNEITFSDWHTLVLSDLTNYSCEATRCMLIVQNRSAECTLNYIFSPSFQGDCAFEPWSYSIKVWTEWSPFSSVVFSSDLIVSPVVHDDPETPDNWWYVPWIPYSFTSWLTSLVSNFWSTIVNWLPTIILVSLWIYAIFALFRVIRNYARSSFNW